MKYNNKAKLIWGAVCVFWFLTLFTDSIIKYPASLSDFDKLGLWLVVFLMGDLIFTLIDNKKKQKVNK